LSEYLAYSRDIGLTDPSPRPATRAHDRAMLALRCTSGDDDIESITASCGAGQVLDIALKAQSRCRKGKAKQLLIQFAESLNTYSSAFDILCQCQPGITTLVWGSMRWLLQMSMNYISLIQRISYMLVEIGLSLPRLQFYERILPSDRIRRTTAELYVAMIEFLCPAILFFNKHPIRKVISVMWSPFETQFGAALQRIAQLQRCLENDAVAINMAQQRVDNNRISHQMLEVSLAIRQIKLDVLELREIQVATLLLEIRSDLFSGLESDLAFHVAFEKTSALTCCAEWNMWFQCELKVSSTRFRPATAIAHACTDSTNAQFMRKYVEHARQLVPSVVVVGLRWAGGMSATCGVALLIYQILQQRPELLYRKSSEFYLRKFHIAKKSFNSIWTVFVELLRTLTGIIISVHMDVIGVEERILVEKLVELVNSWVGPPLNLVLIHPRSDILVASHFIVDLDDCYDVDPSLEVTDPVHQIALNICGRSGHLSSRHIGFLWDNVWRTTRYSLTHIGARLVLDALGAEGPLSMGAPYTGTSTSTHDVMPGDLAFFNSMRAIMRTSLGVIPFRIPETAAQQIRNQLSSSAENASACAFAKHVLPEASSPLEPLTENSRCKIWTAMQCQLVSMMREAMTVDMAILSSIRHANLSSNAKGLKNGVHLDKDIILEQLPLVIATGIQSTLDLI
jgi:hypothetical protein